MGNKSAEKTNKMLGTQTAAANQFANTMGSRATEDRGYSTGSRDKIDQAYWDLYNQTGQGGGGGGGPAYNPLTWADARENESMSGYRNLRDTGGYNDAQIQDFRSRAGSQIPSFFEGLKNQLSAQNAGASGNIGYGSQMAKLARDASRGGADQQLNAEVQLQEDIRNRKQTGLEGVGKYDTELMGNQQRVEGLRNQEIANAQAAARSAAAGRASSAEQAFRDRMGVLGELRGLRGEGGSDLAYSDRQLAGINAGTGAVNARVNEPSFYDQAIKGLGVVAAGAAPFITGGASSAFKKPSGFGAAGAPPSPYGYG